MAAFLTISLLNEDLWTLDGLWLPVEEVAAALGVELERQEGEEGRPKVGCS